MSLELNHLGLPNPLRTSLKKGKLIRNNICLYRSVFISTILNMIKIEIVNKYSFNGPNRGVYEQIYQVWHSTWQEEYSALEDSATLFSNEFTRQDSALGIFVDDVCAATTLFHEVDISSPIGRLDSYFAPWPPELLNRIEGIQPKVLVCSAFTVAKEFRRFRSGRVIMADLLACASLELLKRSDYKLMVGNMRNSRGANKIVYKFGAERVDTVICNSEESDLVIFRRDLLPDYPEAIATAIRNSWPMTEMENQFNLVS